MKMTKEDTQMVEAAKFIKKRCKGYGSNCEGCPFDVSPYCPVDNIPAHWEIPEVPSDKNERGRKNDEKC